MNKNVQSSQKRERGKGDPVQGSGGRRCRGGSRPRGHPRESPSQGGGAPAAARENAPRPWKPWGEETDPEPHPVKLVTPWVDRDHPHLQTQQYGSPKGGTMKRPGLGPPQHSSVPQASSGKSRENGPLNFCTP